jgi:ketosteroid isomerase-like protein
MRDESATPDETELAVRENVEVVRRGIAAWNQRDADLWLSDAAPDVEWLPAGPAAVDSTAYRGHEECARGFAAIWETWAVFELHEQEVRDLGDAVLWFGRVKMLGRASRVELDQEFACHTAISDGKVIRVQTFLSWDDALKATELEA